MELLRTPDSRFDALPDYPFAPNYLQVGRELTSDGQGLRMHYADEGPRDGRIILMMHGEPTWSYLYRHMIADCVAQGYRVLAPDLIGFGKSDKPVDRKEHSYARHVAWITEFIETLGLEDITLVCQDWGSLIGLRVAAEIQERFGRIVLSNGFLPTGGKVGPAFRVWRMFSQYTPYFPVSRIVRQGSFKTYSADELRAYEAPFPSERYKAAARALPALVPADRDDPAVPANRAAWTVFENWTKPFVTCFAGGDPITRGLERRVQERVPGCKGQPHPKLRGGHFIQEDAPHEFARVVLDLLARGDEAPGA